MKIMVLGARDSELRGGGRVYIYICYCHINQ